MSKSYRNSLNLPQTQFPMRAALAEREPKMLERWNHDFYQAIRAYAKDKPRYIVHDGPPYANGNLHIGHAVNKILKDIIVKSKTLSGWNSPFVPGWDCHGLPIELNVEKKFKSMKKSYTVLEFRKACREYAAQQMAIQKKAFQRLGILADWSGAYSTMDFSIEADTIRALSQCLAGGYLEPGFKPVHWCTKCASALAELELEYQDKKSTAVDVRFKVIDAAFIKTLSGDGPVSIPIWTTTPWTLPANEAVALNASLEYYLIQTNQERLILAKDLYQDCLKRYQCEDYSILDSYLGTAFDALQLQHPVENRVIPLLLSDHVTSEAGTGAVHIAPMHGPEDYALGIKYQLSSNNRINTEGYYLDPWVGLEQIPVLQADEIIVRLLEKNQSLLCAQSLTHSYPHCWRHNTPVFLLATPQWFLRLQDIELKQQLNQSIETVQWFPQWGKARMRAMLGHSPKTARPDWCLSRQRYWGIPLPFFMHRSTGQLHPNTLELLETIAQQVETGGLEAWYTLKPEDLLGEDASEYRKSTDILDVWFDSGVTHHTVLKKHPDLSWPADLYLEGSDQFRGWFQSSLLTSVILNAKAPYKKILVHGFTVDAQGRKMSKSLGNVTNLESLIKKWGADIVRLWIASIDTQNEIFISDESFQRTGEAYRRIRNTLRFLLSNLHDFNPDQDSTPAHQLLSLDRWLLARALHAQEIIKTAYGNFNFHLVYQTIHHFCIQELGSFYLSILKDRQYTMPANSIGRRSGQTVLYYTAQAMLRWLAPILSFTSEEAWEHLPGTQVNSVFLTQWYPLTIEESTDPLAAFYTEIGGCEKCWEKLMKLKEIAHKNIEAARNANQIGSALEANLSIICHPESFTARLLTHMQNELHFIFLTSTVQVIQDATSLANTDAVLIKVMPIEPKQGKCVRCWHRSYDVGQNEIHPDLCSRCVVNLKSTGESRYYA